MKAGPHSPSIPQRLDESPHGRLKQSGSYLSLHEAANTQVKAKRNTAKAPRRSDGLCQEGSTYADGFLPQDPEKVMASGSSTCLADEW